MNSQKVKHQSDSIVRFNELLTSLSRTFVEKNKDYGDSYKVDGVVGVIIRLGDKMKRLKQITQRGYQIQVVDEGLEELLGDIANYSLMGLLLMKEQMEADEEVDSSSNEQKQLQQSKDDNQEHACTCGNCAASRE